jgi:hypothetical protein
MRVRGFRRLVGFTTTVTALPFLMGGFMMSIFGALTADDEEEERTWRQRRRDEQSGGTASTHSTSLSRSSLEEDRESQQGGASSLLPLTQPLLPSDELAGAGGKSTE